MSKFGKQLLSGIPGQALLHNRGVLYALCVIALVQIVMYGNVKDFNSIITLLIIGFLVSFFSKNMIIILGVAIFATYIINYVPSRTISEGAENMKESDESKKESAESKKDGADKTTKPSVVDIGKELAGSTEKAIAPTSAEKKKQLYDNLQGDFKDFQKIQDSILKTMKEIDPLLSRAESFIEKFEQYGKLAADAGDD
jgi:hypothetical protein